MNTFAVINCHECGHSIDYHGDDGCSAGDCECRRVPTPAQRDPGAAARRRNAKKSGKGKGKAQAGRVREPDEPMPF